MSRVFIILFSFFIYSCFKAIQLVPALPGVMIGVCVFFFLSVVGTMWATRRRPDDFDKISFKMLSWTGFMFIGFWGTYSLIAVPFDLISLFWSFFHEGNGFLNRDLHLIIFGIAVVMVVVGFVAATLGPKVVEVEIPISQLPQGLKNLKIAQISDLHIGPTIQTRYVKRVVERTNELEPDFIFITGDLVDSHTRSILRHLQPLAKLKAKYGVYYVTGNHEYYWGVQTLLPELEKIGIQILLNSNKVVSINGSKVMVVGIPDPAGGHFAEKHLPNLDLAQVSTETVDLKILLAHRPDPYREAEERNFNIQFSGHTHAGQFFPFSLLIPLAHKYYRGLNQHGKLWLYVNPGTGYWGPANRFGITSEITFARILPT